MNISMSDFRVVDPDCSAFSAAETRISRTSIRLSSLAAAELNYPNYVRIIIGDPIPFFGIVPCDINDRFACPFKQQMTFVDRKNGSSSKTGLLQLSSGQKWAVKTTRLLNVCMVPSGLRRMHCCLISPDRQKRERGL